MGEIFISWGQRYEIQNTASRLVFFFLWKTLFFKLCFVAPTHKRTSIVRILWPFFFKSHYWPVHCNKYLVTERPQLKAKNNAVPVNNLSITTTIANSHSPHIYSHGLCVVLRRSFSQPFIDPLMNEYAWFTFSGLPFGWRFLLQKSFQRRSRGAALKRTIFLK